MSSHCTPTNRSFKSSCRPSAPTDTVLCYIGRSSMSRVHGAATAYGSIVNEAGALSAQIVTSRSAECVHCHGHSLKRPIALDGGANTEKLDIPNSDTEKKRSPSSHARQCIPVVRQTGSLIFVFKPLKFPTCLHSL